MKKIILLLFCLLIFVFSCKSNKRTFHREKSPFIHLDSAQASQRIINFSFSEKETIKWLSFDKREKKTGLLYFYKQIEDSKYHKNFSTASITAQSFKVNPKWINNVTVNSVLDEFVWRKERWWHKNFKYLLLSSNHKKYGKVLIIKYKDKRRYNYSNAVFLYFYKDYGYTIEYKNLEEYFDKYLPDAEKVIETFKIKE